MRDSRAYCECAKHTNKRQMSDKPLSLLCANSPLRALPLHNDNVVSVRVCV